MYSYFYYIFKYLYRSFSCFTGRCSLLSRLTFPDLHKLTRICSAWLDKRPLCRCYASHRAYVALGLLTSARLLQLVARGDGLIAMGLPFGNG